MKAGAANGPRTVNAAASGPPGHAVPAASDQPFPWKPILRAGLIRQGVMRLWTYRTALNQVLILRHTDLQNPRFAESSQIDLSVRM